MGEQEAFAAGHQWLDQVTEDAVTLARHTDPGGDLTTGLAGYSAPRVQPATAIVRQAARPGPNLIPRSFASIAVWHPPRQPYAAGAELAQT